MGLLTIYRYWNSQREGLVIQLKDGKQSGWGEIAPLPGRSVESLDDALSQLLSLEHGFTGPFFNSVAFGLMSASLSHALSWPASLFFMGSIPQILEQLENAPKGFSSAKLKIGDLSLQDAIFITQKLKERFFLRLDVNQKWPEQQLLEFCSHFDPNDFDYIEDPAADISPFRVAYDEIPCPSSEKLEIWKPTVKGIPSYSSNIILGSSFESGLGLASIARLAHHLSLPSHPLGIGTYHLLKEDLLETPLSFSSGHVHIKSTAPKMSLLTKIGSYPFSTTTLSCPFS